MARKRRRRVSAAAQDPLDAILGDTTGVILCSRTSLRYGRHRDDRDLCHLRCPVPASSSMMASASKLRFTLSRSAAALRPLRMEGKLPNAGTRRNIL